MRSVRRSDPKTGGRSTVPTTFPSISYRWTCKRGRSGGATLRGFFIASFFATCFAKLNTLLRLPGNVGDFRRLLELHVHLRPSGVAHADEPLRRARDRPM